MSDPVKVIASTDPGRPPYCAGGTCELFGLFGIIVQLVIGVWCVYVLWYMWRIESPRRSYETWVGDMSKQLVGATWGHFMNVAMAMVFGRATSVVGRNQCVWYLVGFVTDIIFVTFLSWYVTAKLRPVILRRCGLDIGDYEPPPKDELATSRPHTGRVSSKVWVQQTLIWLAITTFVKVVVAFGVILCQDLLYWIFAISFSVLGLCGHRRAQIVVSLFLVPLIGDAFQFAVQDGFLKRRLMDNPDKRADVEYSVVSSESQALIDNANTPANTFDREQAEE
eukprot:TRINITY_DN72741_c0_g1_i1.p2 TRINITY_DN72741_c0_g1~~TRINITY_DN72741_c0_g1_i1.p2  ORF type:complete len:280 (+),score=47.04 TRINITY_DN72741_c0_g1_i1:220-1059(+)